jgi:hypothetical protein
MMRHLILAGLLLVPTLPAAAQTPAPAARPDTGAAAAQQRAELQGRIERNFIARANEELGLTDAQSTKLVDAQRRFADRRRLMERETRRLNEVLAGELRPGIAANERVVTTTLDSLGTLRVHYAQLFREEQRELGTFLTPVQRAQLYRMRERMMGTVADMREQRQGRRMEPPRPPR